MAPILAVEGLTVDLTVRGRPLRALDDVTFSVDEGGTTALIGESGSGKTMTALAVMGMLPEAGRVVSGRIEVGGEDVTGWDEGARRRLRPRVVAMVFQDPLTSLNPVLPVGPQIAEVFRVHDDASRAEARTRTVDLLRRVGIPDAPRRFDEPPHRFSGGMRQRALIAMAVALRPRLLIADEPTTALDVTVQAQILDLLADLREETGMSLLLITHDLGVVARLARHVLVMYAGRVVEEAAADAFYAAPRHPYARMLLRSVPRLTGPIEELAVIGGLPPSLAALPAGCSFHPRCPDAIPECRLAVPPPVPTAGGLAACIRVEEAS